MPNLPELNSSCMELLVNPLSGSNVTRNQLIDSLTSHLSLYHSRSRPSAPKASYPSPKSALLKWFSSLTLQQRQAHLTIVDFKFVQLLIQMVAELRTRGHGFFIALPDIPSPEPPNLPGLCYKKSHGLLSRVAEANGSEKTLFESTRLFGSREGERLGECSCSVGSLDSLTVSEEFVGNVDRFVEIMDDISSGGFLSGEEADLGTDWVELHWLKAKGYYGIEAFVANRLEVALRLAWLNCNNGKKRGAKLKEKATAAGVAANVFWRKNGCLLWWDRLDASTRRKVLTSALGKSAKSLTDEVVKWGSSALEDEMWIHNTGRQHQLRRTTIPNFSSDFETEFRIVTSPRLQEATPLVNHLKRVFLLQCIIMIIPACLDDGYGKVNLFFSALGTVHTISDCILRKLRELLMVISLDCTKLELLGEGNNRSPPSKTKGKPGASSRRKKGKGRKVKRQDSLPMSCAGDSSCDKSIEDLDCAFGKEDLESSEASTVTQDKHLYTAVPSGRFETEQDTALSVLKVQPALRKNGKEKNKKKNTVLNSQKNSERLGMKSSCFNSGEQAAVCDQVFKKSSFPNITKHKATDRGVIESNSRLPSSASGCTKENGSTQSIKANYDSGRTEAVSKIGFECSMLKDGSSDDKAVYSGLAASDGRLDCNATPSPPPVSDLNHTSNLKDGNSDIPVTSSLPKKPLEVSNGRDEQVLTQEKYTEDTQYRRASSSLECSSYEWPSVSPFYFPSVNSQLPPATDRLHLDVGHNWQSRFCHSYVSAVHRVRSSSIDGRRSPIMSRPLPMSLDWPPVVRTACGLASSTTYNYDSGIVSRRQTSFRQGFNGNNLQLHAKVTEDEKYSGDLIDMHDTSHAQDLLEDCDGHWISEEEYEVHAVSGIDYNHCFGGGVMYWNPSDHHGTGFSRPPSLSSDDSVWAWREADMNRAVDDMVAFSSSYSTNGLTSPTAASFCSPFDPLGSGHGYVMPGSDVSSKVLHSSTMTDKVAEEEASGCLANLTGDLEGKTGDSLPYPILRPIIVPNISRERSRSDFKHCHDRKSPCIHPRRRDQSGIKRPPSPVVLCVPRAPRPPPPSPVCDSRKHRGFPTVRSGSSSPRHWGLKGCYHDATEEASLRLDGAEIVWPSWTSNSISPCPIIQPLSSTLLQDRLIAMSHLARDQEHPDIAFPLQPPDLQSCPTRKESLLLMHRLLHDEIDSFCKHVASENMVKKPYIAWAVKRVTRSLQVLWPRSRTNIFGSTATGLSLPTSDVDLVVCLPPVRNLEPIKEAGILEGRNGIKETCLQHAARYLANQEWVKNDSLKTVENTVIPIIMLVVEIPDDAITLSTSNVQSLKGEQSNAGGMQVDSMHSAISDLDDSALPKCSQSNYNATKDSKQVRLDISFKTPSHTGLKTTELVKELTEQFPATIPLALLLKQFLADRSLDQPYSGGLSSYCLVLLIIRFLQHEHHLGRPINQNFGSLLMDFLYFFGNVFDPRQMRVSIQGSGVYINRERGCSIDPIHIDDPLFPANNVGRNCFRIHQCIKAFSEAYSILENEMKCLPEIADARAESPYRLLQKIIPSIDVLYTVGE